MKKASSFSKQTLLNSAQSIRNATIPAACAAILAASQTLSAQSISINFGSNDSGAASEIDTTPGANSAGAVAVSGEFWNNAAGASGTVQNLVDSAGNTTTSEVTYSSANTWRSASPGASATSENGALFKGYLDDGAGVTIDVTTPYLLTDVYVYRASDSADNASAISVNGTYYKGDGAGGTVLASGSGDSWSAEAWTDADTPLESNNYILVENQAAVSISTLQSSPGRASIAGVQLVNAYSGTLSYWDANGATAGSGVTTGLSGVWGTDTFWTAAGDGSAETTAWTAGNAAVFSAGDDALGQIYEIEVSGTQAADVIWLQEGELTFTGGTIDLSAGTGLVRNADPDGSFLVFDAAITATNLELAGGVIDVNNPATSVSGTLTINSEVLLGSGVNLTVASLAGGGTLDINNNTLTAGGEADFTFGGSLLGAAGSIFNKEGAGTFFTNGATIGAIDAFNINGGGVVISGGGILSAALGGSGSLAKTGGGTLSIESIGNTFTGPVTGSGGGFLRIADDSSLGAVPTVALADAIVLDGGTRLQASSDLTLNANRGVTLNGGNSGFDVTGAFTMTVDAPVINGSVDNGEGGIVPATFTKSGSGTLVLNGGSTAAGGVRLEGGTLNVASTIANGPYFGARGNATLNIGTGANITTERFVTSDSNGSVSVINHTDGVFNIVGTNNSGSTAGSFLLGHWGGGSSTVYNLSGGELNSLGARVSMGWDSSDVVFNQTGGTANVLGIGLNNGRNNPALYNLEGGTLNLGSRGIEANANKAFVLGGGTLGSLSSWSSAQSLVLLNGAGTSTIAPSAGHNIVLSGGLTDLFNDPADDPDLGAVNLGNGFIKAGEGTLVLGTASDFTGPTSVNAGTLFAEGLALSTSDVTVASGGEIRPGTLVATGTSDVKSLNLQAGSASAFRLDFVTPDQLSVLDADGLTVGDGHTITLVPTGQVLVGDVFPLIAYSGTIQGSGFAGLSLSQPNPHINAQLTDNTVDGTIDAEIIGIDTITWTGAAGAVWDLDSSASWQLDSDGTSASNFYDFDTVNFVDGAANTNLTLSGSITAATINFLNDTDTYTLAGDGIQDGSLIMDGLGTVQLLNANSYAGSTEVNAGKLVIGDGTTGSINSVSQVSILPGAELELNLAPSSSFSNAISNSGTLTVTGGSPVTLSTAILGTGGSVVINNPGQTNLPTTGSTTDFVLNAGTTTVTGGSFTARWFGAGAEGSFTVNDGAILDTPGFHPFGAFVDYPALTINEGGVWNLGNEQYMNGGDINLAGGTINIFNGKDIRFQGGAVNVAASASGSVIQSGDAGTVAFRLYTGNANFIVADGEAAADLTLNANVTGGGTGFTKSGAGNMLFNGNDTNAGSVTVAEGTLTMGATASLSGPTLIQVNSGAELDVNAVSPLAVGTGQTLGGTGTIDGSVQLAAGNVAPGASPGTLTVTGDLEFGESSSFSFELADWTGEAGVGYDTIVADTVSFTSTALNRLTIVITENELTNFDNTDATFTLATTSAGVSGFDPSVVVVDSTAFAADVDNPGTWAVQLNGNNLELTYTAAEPLGTPFEGYMELYPTLTGADAAPDADPDGDGLANAIEFVVGGDPSSNDTGLLPTVSNDGSNLVFSFRRSDASATDAPVVQYGSDLIGWTDTSDGVDGVAVSVTDGTGADEGFDLVEVTVPQALATAPGTTFFLRLKVDVAVTAP